MVMEREKRKQIVAEPKIQGVLLVRVLLYWGLCVLTVTVLLMGWRIVTGSTRAFYTHLEALWWQFGPAAIASLCVLPIVIGDFLRLSNRFAGPMRRIQGAMSRLAKGERVEPMKVREQDFWGDFTAEFNLLLEQVKRLEAKASRSKDANNSSKEETDISDHSKQQEPLIASGAGDVADRS